jgi:hypothetical protein
MFSFRDQQRQAGAEYIVERERAQAAAAEAEAEYQAEIMPSAIYSQKWRLLVEHREVKESDLVRISKLRNKDTTLIILRSITLTAKKCSEQTYSRLVAKLQRDLAEQGLTRKQSVQENCRGRREETQGQKRGLLCC